MLQKLKGYLSGIRGYKVVDGHVSSVALLKLGFQSQYWF